MRTDCLVGDDWGQPMGSTYATNAMSAMSAMNAEYAQMTDALRWQQQRIIELEIENRELHRQLDDLRRGVGVSLVIDGRQIPLASTGASLAQDAPRTSSGHPPIPPTATPPTPIPVSLPSPITPPQPPQRPNARHSAPAFPENAWLTGPAPAVKPAPPSPQQHPSQPARPMPRQGNHHVGPAQPPQPQRFVPPTWLSEESPTVASWETESEAAPPSHPRIPAQRQHLPHTPIGPVPAEVWRAEQRYESGKLPTLAQMTGQHSAVRIPGKRKKTGNTYGDEHNPFTDSFVLG